MGISYIPYIFITILLGVFSQILLKVGVRKGGKNNLTRTLRGVMGFYIKCFLTPFTMIGVLIYIISIFFWLYVLSKVDLSFAYPFLAMSYFLIILFSRYLLNEKIPWLRWVGGILISVGIIVISRS